MSPVANVMQSNEYRALALYKHGRVVYEHWANGVFKKRSRVPCP